MIAKLFYPKELKNIITDLRAKSDLNEKAVSEIEQKIMIWMFIYVMLCFFLFFDNLTIAFAIALVTIPILIWLDTKNSFEKYMLPYTNGKSLSARIVNIESRAYGDIKYYVLCENKKNYTIEPLIGWRKIAYPKQNDILFIFLNPKIEGLSMPDTPYFKNKYCLYHSKLLD